MIYAAVEYHGHGVKVKVTQGHTSVTEYTFVGGPPSTERQPCLDRK